MILRTLVALLVVAVLLIFVLPVVITSTPQFAEWCQANPERC